MLNLSTAGVQTFTSFSNLDRAGNRLAQSQIAVARAQDLLNNKQLRLNQLQAQGLGNTQKAALLTNELATARADLAVKTDKLKIEEGALFDIQLLFATNIANVMISSLQTIKTLKDLHIASTIKQVIHEKLLATTLFTKTIPAQYAQVGAMRVYETTAKTVINTNRLLTLSIPIVGGAIVGASLAFQAYTDNLGGFRDAVQTVLPFLKDKKELLRGVQDELSGTNDSWQELTMGMDKEVKKQQGIINHWVLMNKLAALEVRGFVESGGVVTVNRDFNTPDTKSGVKIPKTAGHMVLGALALAGTDPIKDFIDFLNLKIFPPEAKYFMKNPNAVAVGPTGQLIGTTPVSMRNPLKFQEIQSIINQPGGGMTTIIGGVPTEVQVTQSGVPFIGGSRFVDNFPTQIIGRTEQNYIQQFQAKYPGAFGKKITGSPAEIQFELEGVQKRLEELSGDNSARAQAEKAVISQLIVFQKNRLNELGKGISPLEFKPGQTGFREAEQRGKIPLAWPFNIQSPMMQKGTLLLPGTGSRLLDPNEPIRRLFYGGNGGQALAYYQLNTSASFGSTSHVLKSMELAQLANTTPKGRRININVDHLVNRGFNDPSGLGPNPYGNFANGRFESGGAFGTRINRVRVPRWVAEERAKFREYMNSPEGVSEIINRRRNQFASDFYFERYAGGESPITQRQSRAISGYFGPGEADKALFKAIVGVNEIPNLPVGVQSLMKIRRSFTEPVRGPGHIAFQTFMKRMGERHRSQNAFLRNAVNRFAGGNYGEFEATTLYGISSYTKNILSSELEAEQVIFQERYGTPLNMEFGTFANVLSDVKRGVSEMNDRLRWNQRMEQISTGATVF